jgi:hypothetical protein
MRERPISTEAWYDLTYVPFDDAGQLAHYHVQVYAFLFEGFESMPVAPS